MSLQITYSHYLKEELTRRCEKNPRYSIRAFARAMDIDVAALSRILSGKQIPSYRLATKILQALNLSFEQRESFLSSVTQAQKSRNLQRISPHFKGVGAAPTTLPPAADLSIELYRVIGDWYHMAIMELTYVEGFESSPQWIARELEISVAEAKLAIERLLNLGLLEQINGKLVKTQAQLSTGDKHLTTPALKKNQKQFLEKAIYSLENDPIEDRNMSSMTMAIDPEKIPEAKKMISQFNRTLCAFLESGKRTRVYNVGISLYPLQKVANERVPKSKLSQSSDETRSTQK